MDSKMEEVPELFFFGNPNRGSVSEIENIQQLENLLVASTHHNIVIAS